MIWFYDALASIRSFLDLGGNVLYAIMLVLFLMWTFILERLWYFYRVHPQEKQAIVDRWGPEHNELAGRAKDMGSAAVFLSDMNVLVCWGFLLVPRLMD